MATKPQTPAGTPAVVKEDAVQVSQKAPEKVPDPAPSEPTVVMNFPRRVQLTVGTRVITFKPGPNEVPLSLTDHWYLKACGVERFSPKSSLGKVSRIAQAIDFLKENGLSQDEAAARVSSEGEDAILALKDKTEGQNDEAAEATDKSPKGKAKK